MLLCFKVGDNENSKLSKFEVVVEVGVEVGRIQSNRRSNRLSNMLSC